MSTTRIYTRDIRAATLPNGLHVFTEVMPHVRSVALGIWVGTGARRESKEQNGISHFIEHMVFQGTENYSSEEIARSIDSIGGNLDAYTARELVSFNTKVLDEHLPKAFGVLSDLVLRPLFQAKDIVKERGVILEELKMEQDNPEYVLHELFSQRFWGGHPLGRAILGTPETIQSFDQSAIRSYFDAVYTPSNMVITAAGNLDHTELLDLVNTEFGDSPARPSPPAEEEPVPSAYVHLEEKDSLEQVHFCLGFPSYRIDHERRYPSYLLNTVLGGGMSSRLFQNIREKRGLAYSVYSDLALYRDAGCVLIGAGTSRETVKEVIDLSLAELRGLKDESVEEEELQRAKDQLKGSLMLSLESTSARMANLARQHLYFGRFFELDEILEAIGKVTAEDLQQMAREVFVSDKLALTALGALDGLEISQDSLDC